MEYYGKNTTSVEANPAGDGEQHYRKHPEQDRERFEMDGRGASNESSTNPEALGQALGALESKKTSWFAYLTTKEFWIVLAIG